MVVIFLEGNPSLKGSGLGDGALKDFGLGRGPLKDSGSGKDGWQVADGAGMKGKRSSLSS